MRMLLVVGLLALQAVVHGQHPNSTIKYLNPHEKVTVSTLSESNILQNAVTESAPEDKSGSTFGELKYTKNDVKSQNKVTTDSVSLEESTVNGRSEVKTNIKQTTSVGVQHINIDKTTRLPKPIHFPGDHADMYSNSLFLQGHVFGLRDDLINMIHMSLSSGNTFIPVEALRVDPLESSFEEMGYEGEKYTQIRYVVSYNGQPIHTEVITRLMSSPKVSHHFKKQLDGRQLREYKAAKSIKKETWTHKHLVAIVVPSCVAFVIILAVVFAVARKRRVATSKMMEQKKKSCKSNVVSDKKCPPPPPYSVVNPAYNFETNAVMEGYTEP
ncbi:uncharacterized protein LOC132721043 [Ruditapes philippinarum]|uniref:uncharacterized protein LOC132721043 n=1 Tax=Ruditapes philippinarum TaxID=129788 RepID=UPI00295BBDDC|nr:uncharacterized protein LOC132721043 [Ruditapes philippinarum]